MKEKVVLAYSGGLDTSVAIKYLQEKYNLEVIAVLVDVGQGKNLKPLKEKAPKIGASRTYLIEAKTKFAEDFILPALKANALYEGKYPLVSALSRPLIANHLVKVARDSGASYVAHGCTGKGNDQVRFELSLAALAPNLKILAPVREGKMSREEAVEYARKNKIPVSTNKKSPYSIDENLWGRSIEAGILEDPWQEPPEEVYTLTKALGKTPNKPTYLEITFKEGVPVALNGQKKSLVSFLLELNRIAGGRGFGRLDLIENRVVGIKSREVYEAPAALALIAAHKELESLTLERDLLAFKTQIEPKYAELIYKGHWFSPLKQALDVFIEETQKNVTGAVRLKFFKGSLTIVGRKSPKSLYDHSLATYENQDKFPQDSAPGFIELSGLSLKTWAKKHREE